MKYGPSFVSVQHLLFSHLPFNPAAIERLHVSYKTLLDTYLLRTALYICCSQSLIHIGLYRTVPLGIDLLGENSGDKREGKTISPLKEESIVWSAKGEIRRKQ
jgi:hypothetical protein